MMIPAAIELGVELRVLAEGEGMAAALAADRVGDYHDADTVLAFAREVDVVTFDHEHVPQDVLRALVDAGVPVRPGPDALRYAQDKLLMRARLDELGLPVPAWARVTTPDELDAFIVDHGGAAVVKTPRGGYDGKGVRVVRGAAEVAEWFAAAGEDGREGALLVEELVDFRRELAQLVARRPSGEVAAWPLAETVQVGGVCSEVIAPAPHSAGRVSEVAADVATTSQFEQHLRAVLDLPLGGTGCHDEWSVMVNLLGGPAEGSLTERYAEALAGHPTVKVHNYGKTPRPGRKVGHVTAIGPDLDDAVYEARAAAAALQD
jgi:5-(carboxyamino)imidazole ribonucleotide synthase